MAGMMEKTFIRIDGFLDKIAIDYKTGEVLNMNVCYDKDGYAFVNGVEDKPAHVHQIVAVMKFGTECIGMTVNHKDNNHKNNSWDNIEVVSMSENTKKRRPFDRLRTAVKSIHIESGEVRIFASQAEAGRVLGLNDRSINKVLNPNHKTKQTKGYTFKRVVAE